jgi:hypothetical protein
MLRVALEARCEAVSLRAMLVFSTSLCGWLLTVGTRVVSGPEVAIEQRGGTVRTEKMPQPVCGCVMDRCLLHWIWTEPRRERGTSCVPLALSA